MSIHHDADRTDRMCALFERKIPVATIAAQFGVQRPAVYKALRRGGLMKPYQARPRGAKPDPALDARRKDSLAEALSNGVSIERWRHMHGVSDADTRRLWASIKRDLGWQAQ